MRIRRTTLKAFLRKNRTAIQIRHDSHFDSMVDGTVSAQSPQFQSVEVTDLNDPHTMGVSGAWFVGGGNDYINSYESETLTGYSVYNCCGSFVLAMPKASAAV